MQDDWLVYIPYLMCFTHIGPVSYETGQIVIGPTGTTAVYYTPIVCYLKERNASFSSAETIWKNN